MTPLLLREDFSLVAKRQQQQMKEKFDTLIARFQLFCNYLWLINGMNFFMENIKLIEEEKNGMKICFIFYTN